MKITLICYVFPPEHCPAGVMVSELAEDLAAHGNKVTVITGWPNHPHGKIFSGFKRKWRHEENQNGYKLIRIWHAILPQKPIPNRIWVYLTFAISSFINALHLERQDVILSLNTPIFGSWISLTLARLWRAKFIRVLMDILPEAAANSGMMSKSSLTYKTMRFFETWNCRFSDVIITLGEGMKQQICNRGIAPDHVRVLPLWLDANKVHPMTRDNAWRREHGIGPDKFIALLTGTIGYAQGTQILLDAAAALQDRSDILLLVVGDGPLKNEMMQKAGSRQLSNIRFIPFQPPDRVLEMQNAADVGIVTLLPNAGTYGLPSKTLGYMATGRAVIVSADEKTDLVRMLREADCGLAAPAQDAACLANAIKSLADDRKFCNELGQRARQFLQKNLSRTSVIAQYERLLKELC